MSLNHPPTRSTEASFRDLNLRRLREGLPAVQPMAYAPQQSVEQIAKMKLVRPGQLIIETLNRR